MESYNHVKDSLDLLSKRWSIDPEVYDLHLGRRNDVVDTAIGVNGVVFHIPTLADDNLYVLWKCIWPDCHNCCERQGRLPLTKDDIKMIAKKMGYVSEAEFIRTETRISSWEKQEPLDKVITTLTMLSLKRDSNEREEQDGTPLKCRFLDDRGYCGIHPAKPGVCWLYPFASWIESDKQKAVIHATFQLTGDCPGFYVSRTLDPIKPVLNEYSEKIYNYNMAVSRTTRENYSSINIIDLQRI
jgi:Fe-S-cluster containining protein